MKVILASQSPYRVQQLKDFGLEFTAMRPLADEDRLKSLNARLTPKKLSLLLAREKALSLRDANPEALIIGADQLVNLKGKILGKPQSREKAIAMLKEMSGKTHQLITSLFMVHDRRVYADTVIARIKMRRLTREDIVRYVHRDQPLDSAGSYKFEKSGLGLVKQMAVSDPSSLLGLPLISLTEGFRVLKVPIPYGPSPSQHEKTGGSK